MRLFSNPMYFGGYIRNYRGDIIVALVVVSAVNAIHINAYDVTVVIIMFRWCY